MIRSKAPLYTMVGFSFIVGLMSYRFLALDMALSFPEMLDQIENRHLFFLLHISFAPVALIVGSLQMIPGLRQKNQVMHRWGGRLYALAILISGLSGIVVAVNAAGGIFAQAGFALLSVIWLYVTFQGVRYARARDFAQHRRWMTYSFALTFAGVLLRLYLVGFMIAGFSYTQASGYLAWMCWVPNLIAVEWWMRRKNQGRAVAENIRIQ